MIYIVCIDKLTGGSNKKVYNYKCMWENLQADLKCSR